MSEPELKKARGADAPLLTHVLAVDVEASGPKFLENDVTEFAACVFRIGEWAEPVATFYRALRERDDDGKTIAWDLDTLNEYWLQSNDDAPVVGGRAQTRLDLLNARKDQHGTFSRKEAADEFVAWARAENEKLAADEKMVVVTDTAASEFDTVWMNVMLAKASMRGDGKAMSLASLFGEYRCVRDVSSFYFGVARKFELWGSEKAAADALGIKDLPQEVKRFKHDHNPLNDALSIGSKLSYFLTIIRNND